MLCYSYGGNKESHEFISLDQVSAMIKKIFTLKHQNESNLYLCSYFFGKHSKTFRFMKSVCMRVCMYLCLYVCGWVCVCERDHYIEINQLCLRLFKISRIKFAGAVSRK